MKINIVEKGPVTFYGIPHLSDISSDFISYWDEYYNYVSEDYNTPIGFSNCPDTDGKFTYYTCIQHPPKNENIFEVVQLPKGNYAIFELKGAVSKSIPIAWKFATENFILSKSPSIEVYSVGNRLDNNYRMDLWIPIDEVLPSFERNKGFLGSVKRTFKNGYEKTVEFSKTDTGKIVLGVGSALLATGVSFLLTSLDDSRKHEEHDYIDSNDEEFETDNYVIESVQEYTTHNYPEDRKSPKPHLMRRKETGEV